MRDTTKIKAIAEEALADLESVAPNSIESTKANLREIVSIAKKMDARTGTSDPSAKGVKDFQHTTKAG